jgi:hypothetical protein
MAAKDTLPSGSSFALEIIRPSHGAATSLRREIAVRRDFQAGAFPPRLFFCAKFARREKQRVRSFIKTLIVNPWLGARLKLMILGS